MPNPLAVSTFRKLADNISTLYESARTSQVRFVWETGKHIVQVEQKGAIRAEYGADLLQKLSAELIRRHGEGSGFSLTNLKRMRQLYLLDPKGAHAHLLSWSDQRELLPVKDEKARLRLEKLIAGKGLKREELRALVRKETGYEKPAPDLPPLIRPTDLKLNTFKLAKPEVASLRKVPKGKVLVDCGFFSCRPVMESALKGLLTETPSYTYCALVERVVDGDTLVVLIDTGFENTLEEKLRLRGINTPELGTPEGERAKKYVQKLLPVGSTIVIKSHKCKTDTYGRFLADVFCLRHPGGGGGSPEKIVAEGEYLNQALLEKGFAVRMEG